MRLWRFGILFSVTCWLWAAVGAKELLAQTPPVIGNINSAPYTDAQAQAANASAIAAAQAAAVAQALSSPVARSATIPTSGPGAGLCMRTNVPAVLTSPPGTTGTCAEVLMCGTSSTYTITAINVGNGC